MKTLYDINTEITKLGMMKYIPDEVEREILEERTEPVDPKNAWLMDTEEEIEEVREYVESRMVERIRVKVWIDTVPEISVTVEGQDEGNRGKSIRIEDGTIRLPEEELREKAKALGLEGEIDFASDIFPNLTVIEGTRREWNGIGAGWCDMYLYTEDWDRTMVFHTPEEAAKYKYTPDQLYKIHCWFNDNHKCTVIRVEEKEDKQ